MLAGTTSLLRGFNPLKLKQHWYIDQLACLIQITAASSILITAVRLGQYHQRCQSSHVT